MSHDDPFLLLSLAKDYAFTYLNKGLLDSLTHYINMVSLFCKWADKQRELIST